MSFLLSIVGFFAVVVVVMVVFMSIESNWKYVVLVIVIIVVIQLIFRSCSGSGHRSTRPPKSATTAEAKPQPVTPEKNTAKQTKTTPTPTPTPATAPTNEKVDTGPAYNEEEKKNISHFLDFITSTSTQLCLSYNETPDTIKKHVQDAIEIYKKKYVQLKLDDGELSYDDCWTAYDAALDYLDKEHGK